MEFIELLNKDVAETRAEKANPADYFSDDTAYGMESPFVPWSEESDSD